MKAAVYVLVRVREKSRVKLAFLAWLGVAMKARCSGSITADRWHSQQLFWAWVRQARNSATVAIAREVGLLE